MLDLVVNVFIFELLLILDCFLNVYFKLFFVKVSEVIVVENDISVVEKLC